MIEEVLKSFITLFVIMDPVGNIPILLGLVKGMPTSVIKRQINNAFVVASVILALFLFFGIKILDLFGIDLTSFRIAGGMILLLLGIFYVLDIENKHRKESSADLSVPIGTPLLVGPGTITTTIILVESYGLWTTLIAAVFALAAGFIVFNYAAKFYKILGRHWTGVISRVMGIILAAIAVEFIRVGVIDILRSV